MPSSTSASPGAGTRKPKGKFHKDLINRGVYGSNPGGTATFIGLRSLDPFLQYQILAHGWGSALVARLAAGLSTIPLGSWNQTLTTLPLPRQILLAMATGSVVKQVYWLLFLSRENFPASAAIPVSIYNTLVNSLNSLLLVTTATSAANLGPSIWIPGAKEAVSLPIVIGSVMYVVGMLTETVAEIQRKRFKDDPKNKGQICTSGLWGWARHVNYAGYTVWRTGYSLAAGGWIAAGLMAAWHAYTFYFRSIPILDDYMSSKYENQWKKYKADVPYQLFPYIY
jgi:protein-S-isoprenylcysteine O-methyltransferase Ste14